ncbi:MAG: hypothetical protein AAF170_12740 [Bacteroidota bacterium]
MLRCLPCLVLLVAASASATPASDPLPPRIELVGEIKYGSWSIDRGEFQDLQELRVQGLLQGIEMGERNDRPCYIKATFARANVAPNQSSPITRTIDVCGPNGPTSRSLESLGSYTPLTSARGTTTLFVCMARSGRPRIKGVNMVLRDISFRDDGSAQQSSNLMQFIFARANCPSDGVGQDWSGSSTCESTDGQYAVGLRVGIADGNSISALQLVCQEVRRVDDTPTTPVSPAPIRRGTIGAVGAPSPPSSSSPGYRPVGSFSTSSVTGSSGTSLQVIEGRPNEVLYGIEFGERSDEACYIKTFWWRARNGRDAVQTRTQTWNDCNGSASSLRYVGVAQSQIEGTSDPLRGVESIRVCTNNRSGNNLKVKGAALRATTVPNGHQQHNTSFERSNCRTWAATSRGTCPDGRHATGLEVHHNTVGGRASITGIALRCKTVQATN